MKNITLRDIFVYNVDLCDITGVLCLLQILKVFAINSYESFIHEMTFQFVWILVRWICDLFNVLSKQLPTIWKIIIWITELNINMFWYFRWKHFISVTFYFSYQILVSNGHLYLNQVFIPEA